MAHSPTVDDSEVAEGSGRLGSDEASRLIADESRRAILETFDHRDAPVTIETLASDVVNRVRSADDAERAMISLHHTHLPTLAYLGLLEYDRENQNVTACTVPFDQLTTQH